MALQDFDEREGEALADCRYRICDLALGSERRFAGSFEGREERKAITTQVPEVAAPRARRTERATEIIYLFGHGVGGRPGERLIKRIGMPTSDDTTLRCLKRRAKARGSEETARVVGVDDWAWRKGSTYGTIIVDSERREVIDLFP